MSKLRAFSLLITYPLVGVVNLPGEKRIMSDLGAVLEQLQQERSRLGAELRQVDQAIRALTKGGIKSGSKGGLGRRRAPRAMSAAARKRIAAAQRARWAKFRAAKRKTA